MTRPMMFALAALFSGPFLAGLGDHGSRLILPFALVFLAAHMSERKDRWPQNRQGWQDFRVLARLTLTFAVQLVISGGLFALGVGMRQVGLVLPLPVLVPILLSVAGLLTAGYLWKHRDPNG
jgi:hypothetical protein